MKKTIFIFLLVLFSISSNYGYSQTDTLESNRVELSEYYSGFGLGYCGKGMEVEFQGTFIFSNNWGASLRYNSFFLRAKNLPDDYYNYTHIFPLAANGAPFDKLTLISFLFLKEFPTKLKFVRFGIEFGPSFIRHQLSNFEPVANPIPFLDSNYAISRENNNSIGLAFRIKVEFPITRVVGVEVAAFNSINEFQSVLGIELLLNLGILRDYLNE